MMGRRIALALLVSLAGLLAIAAVASADDIGSMRRMAGHEGYAAMVESMRDMVGDEGAATMLAECEGHMEGGH